MNSKVQMACEPEVLLLELSSVLPMRLVSTGIQTTSKYRCLEASIKELGIIEPLVVYPEPGNTGNYMLLDGHTRHRILATLGVQRVKCLIATDDEGFTYNHKVNRLSAVQEHFMIRRAIKNGVSEERLARSLRVDVSTIRSKRDMLDGICREAIDLLKDRNIGANAFREMRRVKPMWQIEIAELMRAANNFSVGYAKCLVGTTPIEHTVENDRPKEMRALSPEDLEKMENEMVTLSREFRIIEDTHGKNTLNLVVVIGYLKTLLDNARVIKFLAAHYPELLAEFQKILEIRRLQDSTAL